MIKLAKFKEEGGSKYQYCLVLSYNYKVII